MSLRNRFYFNRRNAFGQVLRGIQWEAIYMIQVQMHAKSMQRHTEISLVMGYNGVGLT